MVFLSRYLVTLSITYERGPISIIAIIIINEWFIIYVVLLTWMRKRTQSTAKMAALASFLNLDIISWLERDFR